MLLFVQMKGGPATLPIAAQAVDPMDVIVRRFLFS